MKDDKLHARAKRRIDGAVERTREQRNRMLDDLEFSNPADPQQWDKSAKASRGLDRPCLVFDQTNQYIAQVVNDARQNKPGIKPIPVDSDADPEVATALEGIIRHIEYVSRAAIAYDTAAEYGARIGLGGLRVVPKVMRPETNEQEIVIQRIHDPLSMILDPDATEPDGSDLRWAAIETSMSKEEFQERWPKAKVESFEASGQTSWFAEDTVRVCEYFEVVENDTPMKVVATPDGDELHMTSDEYDSAAEASGVQAPVSRKYTKTERTIRWVKLSGAEVLEQTEFPSQYIPIVPAIGYELWIKGKRYICGMVRRMRDAAQAYNYERTAYVESVALQPSSPFLAAAESIAGYEEHWKDANTSKASVLPYNHVDDDGSPLPTPSRQTPPILPTAFVQGGQLALADIQAAVGMYRANLGAPSNETSGKAITARQKEGDTANFHYQDNLNRSIEQLGRIIVDMIPRIYDTKRIARMIGANGDHKFVTVDPDAPQAYQKDDQGNVTINPKIGCYDVRIVSGPSYTTLRQEAAAGLSAILQANPTLTPVLGPMWARMQDWPEADKVAKALLAMAPPQVQQALGDGDQKQIPPEAQALMQEAQQHLQQMEQQLVATQQQLQQLASENEQLKSKKDTEDTKNDIAAFDALTRRISALESGFQFDPQDIAQLVHQAVVSALQTPPPTDNDDTQSPPSAGFLTPEIQPPAAG